MQSRRAGGIIDLGAIALSFLDGQGKILSVAVDEKPSPAGDSIAWTQVDWTGVAPAHARTARIRFVATREIGGSTDSFLDSVALRYRTPPVDGARSSPERSGPTASAAPPPSSAQGESGQATSEVIAVPSSDGLPPPLHLASPWLTRIDDAFGRAEALLPGPRGWLARYSCSRQAAKTLRLAVPETLFSRLGAEVPEFRLSDDSEFELPGDFVKIGDGVEEMVVPKIRAEQRWIRFKARKSWGFKMGDSREVVLSSQGMADALAVVRKFCNAEATETAAADDDGDGRAPGAAPSAQVVMSKSAAEARARFAQATASSPAPVGAAPGAGTAAWRLDADADQRTASAVLEDADGPAASFSCSNADDEGDPVAFRLWRRMFEPGLGDRLFRDADRRPDGRSMSDMHIRLDGEPAGGGSYIDFRRRPFAESRFSFSGDIPPAIIRTDPAEIVLKIENETTTIKLTGAGLAEALGRMKAICTAKTPPVASASPSSAVKLPARIERRPATGAIDQATLQAQADARNAAAQAIVDRRNQIQAERRARNDDRLSTSPLPIDDAVLAGRGQVESMERWMEAIADGGLSRAVLARIMRASLGIVVGEGPETYSPVALSVEAPASLAGLEAGAIILGVAGVAGSPESLSRFALDVLRRQDPAQEPQAIRVEYMPDLDGPRLHIDIHPRHGWLAIEDGEVVFHAWVEEPAPPPDEVPVSDTPGQGPSAWVYTSWQDAMTLIRAAGSGASARLSLESSQDADSAAGRQQLDLVTIDGVPALAFSLDWSQGEDAEVPIAAWTCGEDGALEFHGLLKGRRAPRDISQGPRQMGIAGSNEANERYDIRFAGRLERTALQVSGEQSAWEVWAGARLSAHDPALDLVQPGRSHEVHLASAFSNINARKVGTTLTPLIARCRAWGVDSGERAEIYAQPASTQPKRPAVAKAPAEVRAIFGPGRLGQRLVLFYEGDFDALDALAADDAKARADDAKKVIGALFPSDVISGMRRKYGVGAGSVAASIERRFARHADLIANWGIARFAAHGSCGDPLTVIGVTPRTRESKVDWRGFEKDSRIIEGKTVQHQVLEAFAPAMLARETIEPTPPDGVAIAALATAITCDDPLRRRLEANMIAYYEDHLPEFFDRRE